MFSEHLTLEIYSNGMDKESVCMVAQESGGVFFFTGLLLFGILVCRNFASKNLMEKN